MNIDIRTKSERDPRLDFFRGLALVTVYINHVPGNIFENLTSRNFGFSDAAEAFVLMSGIAAGLAYTNAFLRSKADAAFTILKRSAKLYGVHIATTVFAILFLVWTQAYLGTGGMSERVNLTAFFLDPAATTLGMATLGHQLGYFNILPLYIVLLAACPLMLFMAVQNRWLMLGVSVAVWGLAGYYNINFPNFPTPGGWFLNPFSWQLVFSIGLAMGVGAKRKQTLVPYSPVLMTLAVGYVLFSAFVVQFQRFDFVTFPTLPALLGGFDKGILPLPRLMHVLFLAYIVAYLPFARRVSAAEFSAPVVMLGKESLAVFAWGSVICIVLQAFKEVYTFPVALDGAVLVAGLAVQYAIAVHCRETRTVAAPRSLQKVQPAS